MWNCGQQGKELASVSGKYTFSFLHDEPGTAVADSQYLVTSVRAVDSKDSVWYDRDATTSPIIIQKAADKWLKGESGFFEVYNDVSAGDSIVFEITAGDFFFNTLNLPLKPGIDPSMKITFHSGIKDVLDEEGYRILGEQLQKKAMEEQQAVMDEMMAGEKMTIEEHIQGLGLTAQKTDMGVYYVITEQGNGPNIQSGQRAIANYSGYLLDGNYFDSSIEETAKEKGVHMPGREYGPFDFVIDEPGVIQGWHDGFKVLNKGAKATFFIPSLLGYGPRGAGGDIPPNSILIFDVELVDIQNQ